MMICQERSGVTINCSMVPTSFSRTTPIEDNTRVMTIRIMASSAGT